MTDIPKLKLRDGQQIPQVGLGTWQSTDQAQFNEAFKTAIESGYRHFDTAQAYHNEQFLGECLASSGLKREDLFITTKIQTEHFGYRRAKSTIPNSLNKLRTNYVDLLLLHFPVPVLRKKTWLVAEEALAAGQAKSIGVSNYTIRHLKEMQDYTKVLPAVNQVELHVFLQQPELVKYCHEQGIMVEAYSPLARAHIMSNEVVSTIAQKHGKTYAQIMLRFLIEQNLVVIPKSVTPARIKENIDIFDFKLDKDDMEALTKEDLDQRFCWSPVHIP